MTDDAKKLEFGGRQVGRVGFGAMQLPGPGVFGPPRDRDEALAVVRRAVELGVDHIDTAQFYGPEVANELLREALHPYPASLVLVSKVGARRDHTGAWLPAGRPAELRSAIEENLRTLGVDQLHAVNLRRHDAGHHGGSSDVTFDDQLDAMVAARDEGLIAGVGLSSVTLDELLHAVSHTEIVCVQNAFNLANQTDRPVLEACRERGIPYVPFFPLGSAFGGTNAVLSHPGVLATAQRLGATPAQIALAWVLATAPNTLLIPGTASLAHLVENHAAGDEILDADAMAALEPTG